jgi:small-conductance mechanosensitive channel
MWTLIIMSVAALLWLLQVTLMAEMPSPQSSWLYQVALGASALSAVLLAQRAIKLILKQPGAHPQGVTSDLLRAVLTITLYLVTGMMYMRWGLGWDISSVLATSAMMSVIIGLALQPTLGHLFSGVSIEIERPLKVGDYVRRDELEGEVISLNWRSVYLRTDRGSTLVLPNSEFTSRLLEVIPRQQAFRHQVMFNMASDVTPGLVIRVAMQVLRSDLPGVCNSPSPSVLLAGHDPVTGTLRYVARMYTQNFLDRSSMGSAFLERLWYVMSREGLALLTPPASVWTGQDDMVPVTRRAVHATTTGTSAFDLLCHLLPTMDSAGIQILLDASTTMQYGPKEAIDTHTASLVLQGRLHESMHAPDPSQVATLHDLVSKLPLTLPSVEARQLGSAHYQTLLAQGSLALGPLARNVIDRIATLTDDPYLAYRAFAQALPLEQQDDFLAQAPQEAHRTLSIGDWLGWPHALGLNRPSKPCHALQCCTMLTWPDTALRSAMRLLSAPQRQLLVQALNLRQPEAAHIDKALWDQWLQGHPHGLSEHLG